MFASEDAALPGKGFAPSRYETLWSKSPFAVATADTTATTSSDYKLVGMARIDGVSYASLIDTLSPDQQHFLLSSDKPVRGLTLVSVTNGHDASGMVAVIEKDGQTMTLKLEQARAGGAPSPAPVIVNANPSPNINVPPNPYLNRTYQQINQPGSGQPPFPQFHRAPIHFPPRPGQ